MSIIATDGVRARSWEWEDGPDRQLFGAKPNASLVLDPVQSVFGVVWLDTTQLTAVGMLKLSPSWDSPDYISPDSCGPKWHDGAVTTTISTIGTRFTRYI